MPSDTNSPYLGLLLQATGNNSNTWGDKLNTLTITPMETAVAGCLQIVTTGGSRTLLESERINAMILLTGSLASDATISVASSVSKFWVVQNNCTLNGHKVYFQVAAGTPVEVPALLHLVVCDGYTGTVSVR